MARNRRPNARLSVILAGLSVSADASASTDDTGIVSYKFAWGDGNIRILDTPFATHTYAAAGTYNVVLTVTDMRGLTNKKTAQVNVFSTPTTPTLNSVTIAGPSAATVGQLLAYSATAHYSDGTAVVVTPTWSTTNPTIATIAWSGVATALAAGGAGIHASYSTLTAIPITLTVSAIVVTLPGTPAAVSPANAAMGVVVAPTLSWTSTNATSYTVKFGTSSPPPTVSTGQASAGYTPGTLIYSTTYYWQILAINGSGTTTGSIWSFTTAGVTSALLFENFTAARLNGDGTGLTQIYLGEDPLQSGGYDTANGRFYTDVGAPNNGPYVYLAYPRNSGWLWPTGYAQTYLKSGTWPSTPVGTTTVNRISFWVKPTVGTTRRADGGDITQFGTYIRDHSFTDAAWQGAHYYHLINPNYYANTWHKMTFNGTPQHQVGRDPTANWGNEPELVSGSNTGGNGQNVGYMDGLSHFYFDTQNGVAWASNSRWTFAQIEFDTVSGEPDTEISSLVGVYSGTRYELTWAGLKNIPRTYEIVYSPNSLRQNGWASGTSGGTTTNPASAYTGCIWTLTSSELTTGLYVGVRQQSTTDFTEFHFTYPFQPTNP